MNFDQRVEYVRSVWGNFKKLAKTSREIRPDEYDLARKWAMREIPLATVLQGIHETAGKPGTLMACEASVESNVARLAKAVPEKHPVEAAEGFDIEAAKRRKALLLAELRGKR